MKNKPTTKNGCTTTTRMPAMTTTKETRPQNEQQMLNKSSYLDHVSDLYVATTAASCNNNKKRNQPSPETNEMICEQCDMRAKKLDGRKKNGNWRKKNIQINLLNLKRKFKTRSLCTKTLSPPLLFDIHHIKLKLNRFLREMYSFWHLKLRRQAYPPTHTQSRLRTIALI